jgi:hypothetical protein
VIFRTYVNASKSGNQVDAATETMQIIEKATESVDYVDQVPRAIARAIVASYVEGLEYSHCKSSVTISRADRMLLTLQQMPR